MTGVVAAVAAAGLLIAPAGAKPKTKESAAGTKYYLNWGGDCGGSGYLALEHVSNPDACALFFPELGSSYYFGGSDGMPFALDADRTITVDFNLATVVTAAAEFEAVLSATVGRRQVEVASATATVLAAGPVGGSPVHFDLEPSPGLDEAKVAALNLTISWTDGVTYSSMDLESGTATMVVHRAR